MKTTIDPEIQEIIKESIDKAVAKSVDAIMKANEEIHSGERNYYKETERLLYSLPALRLKVDQDKEDLNDPDAVFSPRSKSKDIIRYTAHGGGLGFDIDEYTRSRKSSMERTRREVQRIERALETVQDDQYYDIVPMKYWDLMLPDDIAERLCCDERTYYRHKNRLINKLKIVLFGADAL